MHDLCFGRPRQKEVGPRPQETCYAQQAEQPFQKLEFGTRQPLSQSSYGLPHTAVSELRPVYLETMAGGVNSVLVPHDEMLIL
jgi:hypothetical protein